MKVSHVSFWPPDDPSAPTVTLSNGILVDNGAYTKLSVSDGLARSRELPTAVTGWRVFVSRHEDGELEHVYDGTIARADGATGMAGRRRVFRCVPGGLINR